MARVLMTADAVGGVWQYSLELARGLTARGCHILLAVLGGLSNEERAEANRIGNVTVRVHPGKLEWMDDPWDDVAAAGHWLLALADEFQPSVVHLNGYAHASLSWNAPVVVVAHSCVLSWFHAVREVSASPSWDLYRDAVQEGLRAADLVIAPSRAMLNTLARNYGPLPQTRAIPNGRAPEDFPPGAPEPFIFTAGRLWDEAKNFQVLSEAAAAISWPIYVAGDNRHPGGGHSVMPDRLRFLGPLNAAALAKWYSHAAIYAHPALYEPFGLAVLEAALSGCALVVSHIPSLREIWGDAAMYADARDPNAWSHALATLSRDADLCRARAAAARTRALQFNAAAMTNRYLDAYRDAESYRTCKSLSSVIPFARTGITETPTSSAA